MFIVFNILGFLIFVFIFWKKLREDYLADQIFTTFFYMLLGILTAYFLSRRFLPSWWFWFSFLGFALGLAIGNLRFKLRFHETFEPSILGFIILLSLYFLGDSVMYSSLSSFIGFVVLVILVGIFHYFDMHYKNFAWYKSGRVGFSGLATTALFFLLRATMSLFFPGLLSFVPRVEIILSAVVSLLFFFMTYNLARIKI